MTALRTALVRSVGAVAAAALVAGAAWFPHASWTWGAPSDVDLVSAAHADPVRPAVTDSQAKQSTVAAGGHARATATASTGCTGCTGRAATVEVVYVPRGSVTADNVATTWGTGGAGIGSAVSLQVVVQRQGSSVTATNRALAVASACTGCTADATAVQVVLQTRFDRSLSARTQTLLQQLADLLGTPVPPALRLRPTPSGTHVHRAAWQSTDRADGAAAPALVLRDPAMPSAVTVPAVATIPAAVVDVAAAPQGEQQALNAVVAQLAADVGGTVVSVDVSTGTP